MTSVQHLLENAEIPGGAALVARGGVV